MSGSSLTAAILIVSDTAARDPQTDGVGPALTAVFTDNTTNRRDKWAAPSVKILPDDETQIQQAIREWTDGENTYNLILTSGGTGFAVRDRTPEVGERTDIGMGRLK